MTRWVWTREDESQRLVDLGEEHSRWEEWERRLLSDEEVRNRRLADDEERRCDGLFDRDRELGDDSAVEWPE